MPARRVKSPTKSHVNWVIAKYKDGEWYPARIAKRHQGGQLDVAYDDGDFEEGVARENVLSVGSRLIANVNGKGFKGCYVEGVLKTINADGSCAVRFDDGWGVKKVNADAITEPRLEYRHSWRQRNT